MLKWEKNQGLTAYKIGRLLFAVVICRKFDVDPNLHELLLMTLRCIVLLHLLLIFKIHSTSYNCWIPALNVTYS
jgi:hypothetical protein